MAHSSILLTRASLGYAPQARTRVHLCDASLTSLLIVVHEVFEHKPPNSEAVAGCRAVAAHADFGDCRHLEDGRRQLVGGAFDVKTVIALGAKKPDGVKADT